MNVDALYTVSEVSVACYNNKKGYIKTSIARLHGVIQYNVLHIMLQSYLLIVTEEHRDALKSAVNSVWAHFHF